MSEASSALSAEDNKLLVLARATRARTGAAQAAAVRDLDGRTYAGAAVDLSSLQLSGVQVCVAMAVASGSKGLEAVVTVGRAASEADLALIDEYAGASVPVLDL